ncbi:phage upper tail fiber protein [Paenirhodobacter sp.]|uniref:phage upper tail fiber protein n=1 Tax=Paenirhodobacter sp. TaxID=1965326 RepID=UPI003B5053EE
MDTTHITFAIKQPSGAAVTGGKVTFTLSGFDLDGGIIMPTAIEAVIGSDGTGSIDVWPNIAGLKGTSYKVTISSTPGGKLEVAGVNVPESAAPVLLHTLMPIGTVAGLKSVVLTQAEYAALASKDAQTIYLIRAEA